MDDLFEYVILRNDFQQIALDFHPEKDGDKK